MNRTFKILPADLALTLSSIGPKVRVGSAAYTEGPRSEQSVSYFYITCPKVRFDGDIFTFFFGTICVLEHFKPHCVKRCCLADTAPGRRQT